MVNRRIGPTKRRILLLLNTGLSLVFNAKPGGFGRVINSAAREWQNINRDVLRRAIASLYESKLVDYREAADGAVTIVLSDDGKRRALTYRVDEMEIPKPDRWDGQWRLVIFDIPESRKKAREALRFHLERLGFYPLQKSAFVHPHECKNEIDFLIELYDVRPFVRQITAFHIDNELHLRSFFKLPVRYHPPR